VTDFSAEAISNLSETLVMGVVLLVNVLSKALQLDLFPFRFNLLLKQIYLHHQLAAVNLTS